MFISARLANNYLTLVFEREKWWELFGDSGFTLTQQRSILKPSSKSSEGILAATGLREAFNSKINCPHQTITEILDCLAQIMTCWQLITNIFVMLFLLVKLAKHFFKPFKRGSAYFLVSLKFLFSTYCRSCIEEFAYSI